MLTRNFPPPPKDCGWYLRNKTFTLCQVNYMNNNNGNTVVMGKVNNFLSKLEDELDIYVQWWAAKQPKQTCSNAGFCMPFTTEKIAFERTDNKGVVKINGDKCFKFTCKYPNAYYSKMGTKYHEPEVNFRFCDKNGDPITKTYRLSLPDGHILQSPNVEKFKIQRENNKTIENEMIPAYMRLIKNSMVDFPS